MTDTRWVRLTALAGVVFVILIIVQGVVMGDAPTLTDSAQKIFDYFNNHQRNVKAAAGLYALAMSAVLIWVTGLFCVLRKAEGGKAGLAVTALVGTVLTAATTVISAAIEAATALRINDLDPSGVRVFYTLQQFIQGGVLFGLLLAVGATAAVCLRTGLFARWIGLAGVILAAASVAGAFGIAYASLQPLAGLMLYLDTLFVLVVSVLMWRKPELGVA
jgi:hypothetical protein